MSGTAEFSVYQFFPDGTSYEELYCVDAESAVTKAHAITRSPGAMLGITRRIIITDGGDSTVFEWQYGKGVTFPNMKGAKQHEPESD